MKLLQDGVDEASKDEQTDTADVDDKQVEAKRRWRDNLCRAIDAVNNEISGYDVFDVTKEAYIRVGSSGYHHSSKAKAGQMGEIRGIPEAANVGKEGHTY